MRDYEELMVGNIAAFLRPKSFVFIIQSLKGYTELFKANLVHTSAPIKPIFSFNTVRCDFYCLVLTEYVAMIVMMVMWNCKCHF